ncbi:DUF3920 family protein [Bacillus nitratireducens]|uniref:DUF3920 family protein n=1 Tax=Bacillus nitratireducens TaxID=2026193 RepID=UPI001F55EAB5|nr:DUF3920 family protein [Bacillus nitratireducens]UNP78818.1 DUF3920 family protein [Bacillus nitratireducens]
MRGKIRSKPILLKKKPIHRNRNRKLRLVNSYENGYTRKNTGKHLMHKVLNFLCFVSVIAGIIYYATNDDFPLVTTGVTDEEAVTITQEIVKTQTQLILQDLGVGDDGISRKITIHNTYNNDGYSGLFNSSYVTTNGITAYAQKSGVIDLYPMVYLMGRDKGGNLVSFPANQRPTKDGFRKAMIETLAHELRHYWQHQTGEFFKYPYDTSVTHDERWAEKDAKDYMGKYSKLIRHKN